MAAFIIQKSYIPKAQTDVAQLFMVLTRSAQAEDIAAADGVLKVLSARFPSAVLLSISLSDADALPPGLSEAEEGAWLEHIQPEWLRFIAEQQRQYGVEPAATAIVGVGTLGALVLELAKLEQPVAGRLISLGARFIRLPEQPLSLAQTLHLLHAANDAEVAAKHSQIAHLAIQNLAADSTLDVLQGIEDSLDPALITQLRVRLETCIPLRILKEIQAATGE